MRKSFFNPVNIFLAIIYLVSSTNKEGYSIALERISSKFSITVPLKSALSKFRKKISYRFFEKIFKDQVNNFIPKMSKYKGYHIVGIDGDMYDLPPSDDILKNGYRGYPVKDNKETHTLKMYVVRCVDLLSSTVINISLSHINDEIGMALKMIPELPKGSLAIYDRLYLSKIIIEQHFEHEINFLARCKRGSTFKEIEEFYSSNLRRSFFVYNGIVINLIKVKNPNGEDIVLATNIEIKNWTNKELANLYSLRWDCETSNRDSTSTLKLEDWHTTFYNGILQELYVHLILMNLTKISIFKLGGYKIDLEKNETYKTNFKLIFLVMIDIIPDILNNKFIKSFKRLSSAIKGNIEKRIRLSRSYPREVKRKGKLYKNSSLVNRRSECC